MQRTTGNYKTERNTQLDYSNELLSQEWLHKHRYPI